MIKSIFFDWGYTFVNGFRNRESKVNEILKPFGFTWQTFHPYWRQFYILRSSGKIKTDIDFEYSIQKVTQKDVPVKKIIEITIETHFIPKKHIDIVKDLKKNYKVGILSNNVEEWVISVLKNHKIRDLFDSLVISSKIGERKPNAIIYYEALRKFSVKPEESVFIADEVAEDLVAATGLGMKTIWLNNKLKGWWGKDDEKTLKIYRPDAIIRSFGEVISALKEM